MVLVGFRIAELSAVVMRISWCLFAVSTIANATPQNTPSPAPTSTPTGNSQACGLIGPAAAAFLAQNPRAGMFSAREKYGSS